MADSEVKSQSDSSQKERLEPLPRQLNSPGKSKTDVSTKASTTNSTANLQTTSATTSPTNKTLQSHIAAALKMSATGGATPLIVGLISSANKLHGGGGVVVSKTITTPTPSKVSAGEHLSGSQVVKISAAANPNAGGLALASKLKAVGHVPAKATVSGGQQLTGKPKSFMTMLAGEGGAVSFPLNTGGGTSGKKQTPKKGK